MKEMLKSKLLLKSKEVTIKQMGYNNLSRGLNSLEKLLNSKSLYHWFKSGNYDLKYDSKLFFLKLCEVLEISNEEIEKEIENSKIIKKEYEKLDYSYIFVNTNFKRTTESIFILSILSSQRVINIPKDEFIFKSDNEIFIKIREIIKKHYKYKKGQLSVFGKIEDYRYHHTDGKTYIFNTNGNLINRKEIFESFAYFKIN